jgi:hypothetical protein
VTKNGLFVTSFVAAVPGGFLAYQMVMAFLKYSGGPTTWSKALAGMLLCVGGLLAVMPFGILVFAGPKTEKPPKKAKEARSRKSDSKKGKADSGEVEAEVEAEEEGAESVVVTDQNLEVVEGEDEEFAQTGELVAADEEAAGDDFDMGDASEEEAVFVDSDDFVEEVDTPKKGKKK